MSAQVRTSLISVVTSLLIAALGGLLGKYLSADQINSFAGELAAIIVGGGATLAAIIYKALPASKETKIALAAELPEVSRVVTTAAIADGPKFAGDKTVVSHAEALETSPPAPQAVK